MIADLIGESPGRQLVVDQLAVVGDRRGSVGYDLGRRCQLLVVAVSSQQTGSARQTDDADSAAASTV